LFSGGGMAAGGWIAGVLYDHFGYYMPAFTTGIVFNLMNLVVVGTLVFRQHRNSGIGVGLPSGSPARP
jgi:predicted MFS family arabinose efflux permease